MKRIIFIGTLLVVLTTYAAHAVDLGGWFSWAPYGQPLYADTHLDACRFDISALTMNPSYDYDAAGSPWQVHVIGTMGLNLPVYRYETPDDRFGLSVTLPISTTLWMDLFEHTTSPIVNADYRIATPTVHFIHRLNRGFVRNYSLSLCPFRHESTHVGDELVLQRNDEGYALRRVNVSYNYAQLSFTLNEPEDRLASCHTFRASLMIPYGISKGWYFVEERDGDAAYIVPGQSYTNGGGYRCTRGEAIRMPECFVQYQYQSPTSTKGSIQGVVSLECRLRALYGYDLSAKKGDVSSARSDRPTATGNAFVGIRCNRGRDGYFSRAAFGLRAYYGVCPYGMFRAIPGYSQLGLCLIFE